MKRAARAMLLSLGGSLIVGCGPSAEEIAARTALEQRYAAAERAHDRRQHPAAFDAFEAIAADAAFDPATRALLLPMIRADFEAVAHYCDTVPVLAPFDAPVTVLAGMQDLFAPLAAMPDWALLSTGETSLWAVDEHHYFVETHREDVHALVRRQLMGAGAETLHHFEQIAVGAWSGFIGAVSDTVNDVRLEVVGRPNTGRPTCVFVPGAWALDASFRDALADQTRVVEVGLRDAAPTAARATGHVIAAQLVEHIEGPIVLVAHDSGAPLAAWIADGLERRGCTPEKLVVSGAVGASCYVMPHVHRVDDETVRALARVIRHPDPASLVGERLERLRMALGRMRGFVLDSAPPRLRCDIVAIQGRADLWIYASLVARWAEQTRGRFTHVIHDGDHFSHPVDLIDHVFGGGPGESR